MVAGGHDASAETTRIVFTRGRVTAGVTIVGGGLLAALCCAPQLPPADPGYPAPPPTAPSVSPPDAEPPVGPDVDAGQPKPPPVALCEAVRAKSTRSAERPPPGRIVGGDEARPGSWPWALSLGYQSAGRHRHFCGAVVALGPRLALTAAHCEPRAGDQVVVGRHRLSDTSSGRVIRVADALIHARWNNPTPHTNDIAIMLLAEPHGVQPIELATEEPTAPTGTTIGWGLTSESGQLSDTLQQVELPLLTASYCASAFAAFSPEMFCAGYTQGQHDSCSGDSGGAFMTWSGDRWLLYGLVSFGTGCARPGEPGYYAKIPGELGAWARGCAAELSGSG